MNRRLFLAAIPAALAAGCGFQLRRLDAIPLASLYIDAPPGSVIAARIREMLALSQDTRLTATAAEAEGVLKITHEERNKAILTVSGAGLVTEYRLSLLLTYAIQGKDAHTLAEPETIELNRDMTYSDSQLLAKGDEEQLLYRSMDDGAAVRIIRRLQALKPGNGS